MLTLKDVEILVALKATVKKNVSSHRGQDFSSSGKLPCQLRELTGSIVSSRLLVALKVTGPSALKVVGILVSLKAMVARNVNSHCCQDFGRSESYSQLECRLPLLTGFW